VDLLQAEVDEKRARRSDERLVLSADHSDALCALGPWSAPPKAVVRREACGKIRRGVDAKAADRQLLVAATPGRRASRASLA